jgi:hypothetical protein
MLKGPGERRSVKVCFPSQPEDDEVGSYCPPRLENGDRRIFFLDSGSQGLTRYALLHSGHYVLSVEHLEQVEREIAKSAP